MDDFYKILLSAELDADSVFNPYTDHCEMDLRSIAPEEKLARLKNHFATDAKLLLIGEAPGYQGCRYSGVAFTSEALLLEGSIPNQEPLTKRLTSRKLPWSEPSARIVWETLYKNNIESKTIMWNTFPFHPHKPEKDLSNRKPTRLEIEYGAEILKELLSYYPGIRIAPVGQVAGIGLNRIGVKYDTVVRHPAYGGKPEFMAGIEAISKAL